MRRLASDHQPASVGGWREIVGNPNLAEAILHGIIHNVAGASMRKRRIFEPSAWPSNQRKNIICSDRQRRVAGWPTSNPGRLRIGTGGRLHIGCSGGFVGIRAPLRSRRTANSKSAVIARALRAKKQIAGYDTCRRCMMARPRTATREGDRASVERRRGLLLEAQV